MKDTSFFVKKKMVVHAGNAPASTAYQADALLLS